MNLFLAYLSLIISFSPAKDSLLKKKNSDIDYYKFVTIKQGIWGSCKYLIGDCMPSNHYSITCKYTPVIRTIYIYKAATNQETVHISSNFYSKINTPLVAKTQSDSNGFYQVSLPSGNYSILILENGNYYSHVWGGTGILSPASVDTLKTTRQNLIIDMARKTSRFKSI